MCDSASPTSCACCTKPNNEFSIIDQYGHEFCGEDCMDKWIEDSDLSYDPHPYEDDYLAIRRTYLEWLENWESDLAAKSENIEAAVDTAYEEIDEILSTFSDYAFGEGDDGPYCYEIYQYLLKLAQLQKRIFAWRPNRKTYYWLYHSLSDMSYQEPALDPVLEKISAELYLDGQGGQLLDLIEHYSHPNHTGLDFVFENKNQAEKAFELLFPYFDRHELEMEIKKAHLCEYICDDMDPDEEIGYVNGFFYCDVHAYKEEIGVFSPTELQQEIDEVEQDEELRVRIIGGREDWIFHFQEKIKRSCRTHEFEIPLWALN